MSLMLAQFFVALFILSFTSPPAEARAANWLDRYSGCMTDLHDPTKFKSESGMVIPSLNNLIVVNGNYRGKRGLWLINEGQGRFVDLSSVYARRSPTNVLKVAISYPGGTAYLKAGFPSATARDNEMQYGISDTVADPSSFTPIRPPDLLIPEIRTSLRPVLDSQIRTIVQQHQYRQDEFKGRIVDLETNYLMRQFDHSNSPVSDSEPRSSLDLSIVKPKNEGKAGGEEGALDKKAPSEKGKGGPFDQTRERGDSAFDTADKPLSPYDNPDIGGGDYYSDRVESAPTPDQVNAKNLAALEKCRARLENVPEEKDGLLPLIIQKIDALKMPQPKLGDPPRTTI